jgi:hypothetical protein
MDETKPSRTDALAMNDPKLGVSKPAPAAGPAERQSEWCKAVSPINGLKCELPSNHLAAHRYGVHIWYETAPPATSDPAAAPGQQIADDILRRIALRYKNCQVYIFPDLPELTPVEGVLRCAQEEGFTLTSMSSGLSTTVYLYRPPTDLLKELEELRDEWRKAEQHYGPLHACSERLDAIINHAKASPKPSGESDGDAT